MSTHHIIILTLIYVLVGVFVFHLVGVYFERRLDRRLEMIRSEVSEDQLSSKRVQFKGMFERFLAPLVKWSMPKTSEETSKARDRLIQAGYRGQTAVIFYYGLKSLLPLALLMPFLVIVLGFDVQISNFKLFSIGLAIVALGYYLPEIYVSNRISQRQQEIFEAFPDALDLIRVCVTAGLGLDSAIARVGQLIGMQSKVLAQDFRLLSLELRAGVAKSQALRNFAKRTGLEEINALVSMLIQADRFGTSIAESLRVHSESLRTQRQRKAQEKAAQVPVKLTIPMMLCILPALFVVILGPAILDVMAAF